MQNITSILKIFSKILLLLVFLSGNFASTQTISENFKSIDLHAKEAPAKLSADIDALAEYLMQGTTNEEERARAAFTWIAHHIRYDYGAASLLEACDVLAIETLHKGKAVCEGYAALFQTLGRKMNLEVKVLKGYSKGFGYKPGKKFTSFDHSWNAVLINGKWQLMDVTWAAGYMTVDKGKIVFQYKFNPFWFMTEPEAFVFSHFPVEPEFLLFTPAINLDKFSIINKPEDDYFVLGFTGKESLKAVLADSKFSFPLADDAGFGIKKIICEPGENLKAGKNYDFAFTAEKEGKIWALNNEEPTEFNKSEKEFSLSIKPKKGELWILFQPKEAETMLTFLMYKVMP